MVLRVNPEKLILRHLWSVVVPQYIGKPRHHETVIDS
jgi:hypothetical protein